MRTSMRSVVALASACLVTVAAGLVAAPGPAMVNVSSTASAVTDPAALASQQAKATGRPVKVASRTTATDELVANPSGTFTLTRYPVPVRARVKGQWLPLDATLRADADGSISPTVSTTPLTLSGGGSGPMATLRSGLSSLALTLPMSLPTPTLSGATATYGSVLPGVDLQITVDPYGGFSHTLVVQNAEAARNPALRSLRIATAAKGITVKAGADGGLEATDRLGKQRFFAEPPKMWDNSQRSAAARVANPRGGVELDAQTRQPAVSTARSAGVDARVVPLAVSLASDSFTLTPDASMLAGPDAVFPLFIDPQWHVSAGVLSGYASVALQVPAANKWGTTADPVEDYMQLGTADTWKARTMVNFDLNFGQLGGATINSATLGSTFVYSWSCTASDTRVYAPAATLTPSNATWNIWFGSSPVPLGGVIDTQTFAAGYNGNCPAAPYNFNVTSAVLAAVTQGKSTQTFVFTGGANETSPYSYKKFSISNTWMSIEYNHAPNPPASLTTSPTTACPGGPDVVGDSAVAVNAVVSDPDGTTNGVEFNVWKSSTPQTLLKSTDPAVYTVPSGQTASLTVTRNELATAAGGAITEFSWRVRTKDPADAYSPWSTTCRFSYDPTTPGAPQVQTPLPSFTIGQPATITVTKPASGPTPAKYRYQLNDRAPATVNADASGDATITITPNRITNTLAVFSVSPGGNVGDIGANPIFNASPPAATPPAGDVNGDGTPDLISAGGGNGLSPGVWLSTGLSNGTVNPVGTNIGVRGNGVATTVRPDNFTGAQIITGRFTGRNIQDVAVYYPATTPDAVAGSGMVIGGNGDASDLTPTAGNEYTYNDADLLAVDEFGSPIPGSQPRQIVAIDKDLTACYLDNASDLMTIAGVAGNYHLAYLPFVDGPLNPQPQIPISAAPPVGATTWDQWRLATTTVQGNVDMFLWHPPTGALYLWRNLDMSQGDLTYTQYLLRTSGWNTGANLTLQAADLHANGTPDVWTVATDSTVTVNTTSGLSGGTGTIDTIANLSLTDATHLWTLNDMPAGAVAGTPITTAADLVPAGTTARTLTASGGATWNTGELFSPDAKLDGVDDALSTAAAPVASNADFTVSAWVKPTALGGTVLSQSGTNTAAYKLWADAGDASWRFAMSTSDTASPTWDMIAAAANSVQLNAWTELTARYTQSTGTMRLFINDVSAAAGNHTTTWNATGGFRIGDQRTSSTTFGARLAGQVAYVQAWNRSAFLQADIPGVTSTELVAHPAAPTATAVVGRPATVTLTPPAGTTVAGYYYGVGTTSATASIWAPADATGTARIPVVPLASTPQLNRLVVQAVDPAGRRTPLPPWGYNWLFAANPGGGLPTVVGDLHNDGRGDAIFLVDNAGTVSVWGQTSANGGLVNSPTVVAANVAQTAVDQTLIGDFDGDGRADIAILHQQEAARTTLLIGRGGPNTIAAPVQLWDSGSGNWDWARSKPVVGDFDGDGRDDISVTYDYGNATFNVWVLRSTSTAGGALSFALPTVWWANPAGWADWWRMKMFAGDFNGDGRTDLGFFYDYGSCYTRMWVQYSTGSALGSGAIAWDGGPNNFCWDRSTPVVGDFTGDGRDDVGAFYRYDGCQTRLWVNAATASGFEGFGSPFDSGPGTWCGDLVRPYATDFNGDGKVDISVYYISGTNQAKLWRFPSTGPSFNAPVLTYNGPVTG